MRELTRSDDPVYISWVQAQLNEAGIDALVYEPPNGYVAPVAADFQKRVMVAEEDLEAAAQILKDALQNL